jgi:hypothetical protein
MKMLPVLALSGALLAGIASAATPASSSTAAPSCKQQATQQKLKGEARVKFIKECKAARH